MSVRDSLTALRERRLGGLSAGYYPPRTALSAALDRLAGYEAKVTVPRPSRLDEVASRVNRCLDEGTCATLELRDWRIVPWIMWQKTNAADRQWFLTELFQVLSEPNRPLSAMRALVHSYVAFFDPHRDSVGKVASFLRHGGLSQADAFGRRWLAIDDRFAIFDPARASGAIAKHALAEPDLRTALTDAGISTDRLGDCLAERAFEAATASVASQLRAPHDQAALRVAVDRLLDWNTIEEGRSRYAGSTSSMATKLFEALDASSAAQETVNAILEYSVAILGDPRIEQPKWRDVSEAAREVAMRLLVGTTLEHFFGVISATAERRHWQDRRLFWFAYYEQGVLEDAWVAFGPRAAHRAQDLQQRYASLKNAFDEAHSAVIMRIGELVIVEWSHNGRCRFFPLHRGLWVPGCYSPAYDYRELHARCSVQYLSHMGSWQPKFAAKIYEFTGIRHPTYGAGS